MSTVDAERPAKAHRARTRPGTSHLLSAGSRRVMWLGLALGLAFYALFGVVPALANLLVSFTDYSGIEGSPTQFVGITNYKAMFSTDLPGVKSALVATVIFVVATTVVQNAFGLLLAHRLQGERKLDSFLRALIFVPIVLGVTVVGLIWILVFNPSQGPAYDVAKWFGTSSAFFGSDRLALPLVIGVQIWQNLGFCTLVYIGGLKAIGADVYEAAALDGISTWRRLRDITLPLMAPSMTINILLAVIGSFTTYNIIYILTQGNYNTDTLGMLAFNSAFGLSSDLGLGAAVTIMLFVLTLIVALPTQYLLRRRERRMLV